MNSEKAAPGTQIFSTLSEFVKIFVPISNIFTIYSGGITYSTAIVGTYYSSNIYNCLIFFVNSSNQFSGYQSFIN